MPSGRARECGQGLPRRRRDAEEEDKRGRLCATRSLCASVRWIESERWTPCQAEKAESASGERAPWRDSRKQPTQGRRLNRSEAKMEAMPIGATSFSGGHGAAARDFERCTPCQAGNAAGCRGRSDRRRWNVRSPSAPTIRAQAVVRGQIHDVKDRPALTLAGRLPTRICGLETLPNILGTSPVKVKRNQSPRAVTTKHETQE